MLGHVAALVFLVLVCGSRAWSQDGHDRIARVAQGLLAGKHRDQIRTMMHSDVIDAADWELKMTAKYPETDPLHWHRQQPEWTCGGRGGLGDREGHVRCDVGSAEKGSLFCALAYFFEHFTHDALLRDYPPPKEPIGTPEELQVLKKIPSSELTTANFLRWLTILVGDLHQPLHWLHDHNYGKEVRIRWKEEEYTLLAFWEDYLPRNIPKLKNTMHPDATDKDYGARLKAWGHKVPTELFREWAKEAAEKLCTEVYAPMTVNHGSESRIDSPFTLTEELYAKWSKLVENHMALGGERLAFVLNDLIEHKRHKEAHRDGRALPYVKLAVGTAPTQNKASKEASTVVSSVAGAGAAMSSVPASMADDDDWIPFERSILVMDRQRSRSDALYNLVVAIFLVPSLLLAFSWHREIGGGSIYGLTKKCIA